MRQCVGKFLTRDWTAVSPHDLSECQTGLLSPPVPHHHISKPSQVLLSPAVLKHPSALLSNYQIRDFLEDKFLQLQRIASEGWFRDE